MKIRGQKGFKALFIWGLCTILRSDLMSNKNILIYKFILKLIVCSIGVALLNLITYEILSIPYADRSLGVINIVSVFFRDLLFRNNFYWFNYSIILSILGFVTFLYYEYLLEKENRILHEMGFEPLSIKRYILAIFLGLFIWGAVLIIIGLGLMVSYLLFLIFLQVPYYRGWDVLLLEDYFNNPTIYFYRYRRIDSMSEFFIGLIHSALIIIILFALYAKRSRFPKIKSNSWVENTEYKYHNRIRFIYILYLIYLAPTVFVWLYPIILNWLDKLPSDSLTLYRIRYSYEVLSYFFVFGFILIILSIIKNNKRVMMSDMRKEIKNEILEEIKYASKEVTIGKQVWMTENLNVDKFCNGDPIPHAKTDVEWEKAGKNAEPAWCYYNNDPDNGDRYGKLYNWYAVNDPRGLAPEGWKIPSDEDWSRLIDFLGGKDVAGKKMKSTDFWADDDVFSGNGTNESGFSGLPGGFREGHGTFNYIGTNGYWWSSTEDVTITTWSLSLLYSNGAVNRNRYFKGLGFSVRCLRD